MTELAEDRLPHDTITLRVTQDDCGKQLSAWPRAFRYAVIRRVRFAAYGATATIHNLDLVNGNVDIKITLEGQLMDAKDMSEMSHVSSWKFDPGQIPKTKRPETCRISLHRMLRRMKR